LFEWNPDLVLTSVTNFGQTGPYSGYKASDLVLQAMSGIMQISGFVDREPLKHGLRQSLYCGGLNVAHSALAGLRAASASGKGQHVDLSIHECLVSELVMNIPYYALAGVIQGRRAVEQGPFSGEPIPTRDGFVTLQAVAGRSPFELYAELFNRAELLDPALNEPRARIELADWLQFIFGEALADWNARELFLRVSQGRQLAGFVQGAEEILECPQLEARNFFVELDHPATGSYRFPGEFAALSETPFAVRLRSPLLGEHTDAVLEEAGFDAEERHRLRQGNTI